MTRTAALNRVCVIGLDGVPCTLLEKLADEGVMPAVAELRGLVPLRRMRVSIPEISAVSWTSFATGANPGVHGIFGFVDLAPGGYQLRFPRFTDCRAATIWDKVGYAGGSSVVINQPFTYPARPLEGALVSGFVALDLEQSVYPTGLVPELERIGYAIDIDTSACREDHELLWRQLHETLEGRRRAVELLWPRDWTYFQAVVTGTDRLFHFLWDAVEDAGHAYHAAAMEYFRAIDRFIADTWERFRDGNGGDGAIERFFLISDHGFCGIRSEVYLNRWLQEEGYLRFRDDPPAGLEDMDPDSRAFCLDPGRIFINAADRFPAGGVPLGQVAALLEEIQTKLSKLQYKGTPVIRNVFRRDEIYSGPVAGTGPDLVALSHHGFDLKGSLHAADVFSRSGLQGMHTWDDALALTGAELPQPLLIWDVTEAVLNGIGIR